jgi:hypothetical protein
MPELRRAGKPTLHYALDDYTDPWRDAPYLILQHGYGPLGTVLVQLGALLEPILQSRAA